MGFYGKADIAKTNTEKETINEQVKIAVLRKL